MMTDSHNSGYSPLPSDDSPLLDSGTRTGTKPTSRGGSLTLTSTSYSYSYGSPGLPGLLHNYYALGCAVFVSIGGLTFGYDQGVIANVLVMKNFLERWPDIGAWEKGLMTAVLELLALIGSLACGVLADRYSRRQSIIAACVIFCIGSALQCGAVRLRDLVLGRAIGGFGVGALSMLCPLYMAEISPPEFRGSLMALEQLSIVFGCVLGFWVGFFTRGIDSSASWRVPLGIQLVPGIFLAFGCFFLPPSPRLLVAHGRSDEALLALAKLRLRSPEECYEDPLLQIELLEMQVETRLIQQTVGVGAKATSGSLYEEGIAWTRLFNKKFIDRTWIGILMMFFQQWSGINALLYYGPTLMHDIGLQGDTVTLLVAGGIGIVQFIAVFPAIIYIDRWGRKPLLRGGSIVMTCAHLTIALLVRTFSDDWASHSTAAWTAAGCVYVFTAAYGVSYGPIGWVLPSEVFPQSVRSKGVALSVASNWLNNFLIGLITPGLMKLSAAGGFLIFAVACFLGYLWSTYVVPETANVSLEEIDALFGNTAGREDMELKRQIERDLGLHDIIQQFASD